jgi:hypothetical protein
MKRRSKERDQLFCDSLIKIMFDCYPLVSPISWLEAYALALGFEPEHFGDILQELVDTGAIEPIMIDGAIRAVIPGAIERRLQNVSGSPLITNKTLH